MRNGFSVVQGLIIMVAIILIVFAIYSQTTKKTVKDIDDLQSCGGLLGSLGGGEGKCMEDKTCRGKTATEANGILGGDVYYQYVGDFGCNESTGGKEPACCIQLPEGKNPLRAGDVNRVKCTAELQPGEWVLQKGIECVKITGSTQPIPVTADQELVFIYKPKDTDNNCKLYLQFVQGIPLTIYNKNAPDGSCFEGRNSDGVVMISTSVLGYMDEVLKTYGSNLKFDASEFNGQKTLPGELRGSQNTAFTLSVTNPNNRFYCSQTLSVRECANIRVGGMPLGGSGTCQLEKGGGAKCVIAG